MLRKEPEEESSRSGRMPADRTASRSARYAPADDEEYTFTDDQRKAYLELQSYYGGDAATGPNHESSDFHDDGFGDEISNSDYSLYIIDKLKEVNARLSFDPVPVESDRVPKITFKDPIVDLVVPLSPLSTCSSDSSSASPFDWSLYSDDVNDEDIITDYADGTSLPPIYGDDLENAPKEPAEIGLIYSSERAVADSQEQTPKPTDSADTVLPRSSEDAEEKVDDAGDDHRDVKTHPPPSEEISNEVEVRDEPAAAILLEDFASLESGESAFVQRVLAVGGDAQIHLVATDPQNKESVGLAESAAVEADQLTKLVDLESESSASSTSGVVTTLTSTDEKTNNDTPAADVHSASSTEDLDVHENLAEDNNFAEDVPDAGRRDDSQEQELSADLEFRHQDAEESQVIGEADATSRVDTAGSECDHAREDPDVHSEVEESPVRNRCVVENVRDDFPRGAAGKPNAKCQIIAKPRKSRAKSKFSIGCREVSSPAGRTAAVRPRSSYSQRRSATGKSSAQTSQPTDAEQSKLRVDITDSSLSGPVKNSQVRRPKSSVTRNRDAAVADRREDSAASSDAGSPRTHPLVSLDNHGARSSGVQAAQLVSSPYVISAAADRGNVMSTGNAAGRRTVVNRKKATNRWTATVGGARPLDKARQRREAAEEEERKRQRKQEAELAFKTWLAAKRQQNSAKPSPTRRGAAGSKAEAAESGPKSRSRSADAAENYKSAERVEDATATNSEEFQRWLKSKEEQEHRERLTRELQQQELSAASQRSRMKSADPQVAFRRWLKKKKQQQRAEEAGLSANRSALMKGGAMTTGRSGGSARRRRIAAPTNGSSTTHSSLLSVRQTQGLIRTLQAYIDTCQHTVQPGRKTRMNYQHDDPTDRPLSSRPHSQ